MVERDLTAAELKARALQVHMRRTYGVWYKGDKLVGGVIPFRQCKWNGKPWRYLKKVIAV